MLNWSKQFNIFCFLDNQEYNNVPHTFECLLAVDPAHEIDSGSLEHLDTFISQNNWVFGHLTYDLKSQIYGFTNERGNGINFPDFYFFIPRILLIINNNTLSILAENPNEVYRDVISQVTRNAQSFYNISFMPSLTKGEYIEKIKALQKHILRGDCYEINFCMKFFSENASIDPAVVYNELMKVSPNPFSAFYKWNNQYLICASPERFICYDGERIISQPIKGTIKRDLGNVENDLKLKQELFNSQKDRSENVMVVDMVRNDLTKVCSDSSVMADELFGIYSFPQVHQMISTISGRLKEKISFSEVIKATFPMGSMTGAPKQKVIQLIDQYEKENRGIFSGSVGYISPEGKFDFNVIIRSIMYNADTRYISYHVGSGITYYSDPELEWEECLLKAEGIKKVLVK